MTVELNALEGEVLTGLAFAGIRERLGAAISPTAEPAWLRERGACFVTLEWSTQVANDRRRRGALHGCIGSIEPRRPLGEDVRANASSAAFEDPRCTHRLVDGDLSAIDLSVAVLGPLQPFAVVDEADARSRLRSGIDGVVLRWRHHRGVFLPKVWDQLPEPREFLDHLKQKAGLPADFWAPDLVLERYEARPFTSYAHERTI